MADDSFRSNRNRESQARDGSAWSRGDAGDPLAELARLIGQGDPYAEGHNHGRADEGAGDPALDWAAGDDYADDHESSGARYAPPPPPNYASPEQDYPPPPPPAGQFFSGAAGKFNGFGDDRDAEEAPPVPSTRQLPAFLSAPADERYESDTHRDDTYRQDEETEPPYQADDYYDEPQSPRRRSGLIVVMAVLGLAVIGTAGAFAYRAMFGGSVFAGLPPIIKASTSPIRIMPSNDAQADNSSSAAAGSGNSAESVVPREEQPMEPPKAVPRVVATIPVVGGQMTPPPALPNTAPPPVAAAPLAMPTEAPSPPAVPAPIAASATPQASQQPAQASPEPKKVRTVAIHANQSTNAPSNNAPDASAQPAAAPAAPPRNTARSAAPKPSAPPAGANAPLSIVPGADGETAAPAPIRARAPAPAPYALASAEPANAEPTGATTGSAGGYAVQVTSQHNEADAQASFRTLQSKFPTQLGGKQPIIRRADLGAKGIYYRALVGPFASAEEAAGLCSSLKAAGGNCIVQRN